VSVCECRVLGQKLGYDRNQLKIRESETTENWVIELHQSVHQLLFYISPENSKQTTVSKTKPSRILNLKCQLP